MNNLADRIVAFGVGGLSKIQENGYRIDRTFNLTADQFTHSWEVAGSLMEKCDDIEIGALSDGNWSVIVNDLKAGQSWDESLPHAIILACIEALEAA